MRTNVCIKPDKEAFLLSCLLFFQQLTNWSTDRVELRLIIISNNACSLCCQCCHCDGLSLLKCSLDFLCQWASACFFGSCFGGTEYLGCTPKHLWMINCGAFVGYAQPAGSHISSITWNSVFLGVVNWLSLSPAFKTSFSSRWRLQCASNSLSVCPLCLMCSRLHFLPLQSSYQRLL